MAHIYVYSPSGAVVDKAGFRRGLAWLKQQGHAVEVDPNALTVHQRFAGDDDTRLAAIERAALSGADLCLPTRGGYGITRLVHRLPLKAIERSLANGCQWMGFSDFTAWHCGVWQGLGQGSWAGLHLIADLGAESPDDITTACFDDVLNRASEGTGWRLKRFDHPQDTPQDQQLAKGGVLWGGNLAVLTSLQGSPHFPRIKRGVLFLEDVGEHPYRVERLMLQLLHSGVLDAQQLIVMGQFNQYQLVPFDRGFNLKRVVQWLSTQTRTPIVCGLPFGHVPTKVCLPFGQKVDVMVQGNEALMLWGSMH